MAASPQILNEVRDKMLTKQSLRKWLQVSDDEISRFLDRLSIVCNVVPGHRQAHEAVPADPKDDIVIAAALEANAAYIVNEDNHHIQVWPRSTAVARLN